MVSLGGRFLSYLRGGNAAVPPEEPDISTPPKHPSITMQRLNWTMDWHQHSNNLRRVVLSLCLWLAVCRCICVYVCVTARTWNGVVTCFVPRVTAVWHVTAIDRFSLDATRRSNHRGRHQAVRCLTLLISPKGNYNLRDALCSPLRLCHRLCTCASI